MHCHTHGPLPRLGADTGTLDAADNGSFRRAHIVTVEAGNGEGLQDVKFNVQIFERVCRRHFYFLVSG
jgi:hypothetical protein